MIAAVTTSSDLLGVGLYTIPDAARLARLPMASVRRWTTGYAYVRGGRRRELPPAVRPQLDPVRQSVVLTFRDLQEIRFLDAFRRQGVSWHTLHLASEAAKEIIGNDHPFSTGRFRSAGNAILSDVAEQSKDGALLDVVRRQFGFKRVLGPYLRGVDFARDEPVRWFPRDDRLVVLDPRRRFGQPIVTKEGVPTRILAQAFKAEGSYRSVARWYEVDIRAVKAAVEFEQRQAA